MRKGRATLEIGKEEVRKLLRLSRNDDARSNLRKIASSFRENIDFCLLEEEKSLLARLKDHIIVEELKKKEKDALDKLCVLGFAQIKNTAFQQQAEARGELLRLYLQGKWGQKAN
jgi:hypothetical protein